MNIDTKLIYEAYKKSRQVIKEEMDTNLNEPTKEVKPIETNLTQPDPQITAAEPTNAPDDKAVQIAVKQIENAVINSGDWGVDSFKDIIRNIKDNIGAEALAKALNHLGSKNPKIAELIRNAAHTPTAQ